MTRAIQWFIALAAPLLLASCILTPTKFTSSLDIRADRHFTFTYVGEVQMAKTKSMPDMDAAPGEAQSEAAPPETGTEKDAADTDEEAQQLEKLAGSLSKEYGFRSVRYIGHRTLAIDYAISGTLDHAFVFPFNPDAEVLLPFIAIELRGRDRVRVKAPGFASQQGMPSMPGGMGAMGGGGSALDGTFTLTTDATIVSQNQEEGAQTLPDGSRRIVWKATPQTKDAPMAVLRLDALP